MSINLTLIYYGYYVYAGAVFAAVGWLVSA
jgi:hypothetical protein